MKEKINLDDKIFIAGASGMVGSSIKRVLTKYRFKNLLIPKREELNLLNSESVSKWFKKNKPDIVILAAAKVGGIYANATYPADFLIENLKIEINIIENALQIGSKRLLFLGSSCIYPKFAKQPIKEEYLLGGNLEKTNEGYALAKISGLKLCELLREQYKFDAISLMPTNLYGPNDNYHPLNSHVVPSLIRKFIIAKEKKLSKVSCWGTGSVSREFLYVDDLAEAVIFCLKEWYPTNKNSPKDIFGNPLNHLNVGTGVDITIKDLANMISKIIDYNGKIIWDNSKPDGTPRKILNVNRINKLGWRAKIDLETGLKKTIKELNFDDLI